MRQSWLPVLSGVVAGLSPHTSADRVVPSIVGGVLVAGAVFGWQRWSGVRADPTPLFERPSALHGLALVLALVVVAPTLVFLFEAYTNGIWENGHGVLAAIDAGLNLGYLGALGLVTAMPGLSLVYLGSERTRRLLPVFVMALFLIPVPTAFAHSLGLPQAVAIAAQTLLAALGVPVSREGVLLFMTEEFFAVSDRCSGVAALVGGYAVAAFVTLYTRSTWRRVAAWLLPWPLTVGFSGLRVAILVALAGAGDLRVLESASHGLSGIAVFWLVVLPVALLVDRRELRARLA
jgi:exosortase/archaeosortase family protein